MNNKFLLSGMLIGLLTFSLMLSGCDNGSTETKVVPDTLIGTWNGNEQLSGAQLIFTKTTLSSKRTAQETPSVMEASATDSQLTFKSGIGETYTITYSIYTNILTIAGTGQSGSSVSNGKYTKQ
ncbi:MAG: hypothetical protein LBT01_02195 [Spirochaetaceae bacterium]|jgi:hypothetical protein|nr:hypothetical protein [Spirochaetaceae bacterium]